MEVQTHKQTKASGICHQFSKHGTCKFVTGVVMQVSISSKTIPPSGQTP